MAGTAEKAEAHYEYRESLRALYCKKCCRCITPGEFENHLARKHGVHADVREYVSKLDVARSVDEVALPTDGKAVAGVPVDAGLYCMVDGCRYVRGCKRKMYEHLKEAHEVELVKGSRKHAHLIKEGPAQFLFEDGTWKRYFRVQETGGAEWADERWRRIKTADEVVGEVSQKQDYNAWRTRTCWRTHLSGVALSDLGQWVRPAESGETELQAACSSIAQMIEEAHQLLQGDEVCTDSRILVKRFSTSTDGDHVKPLRPQLGTETRATYAQVFQSIMRYFLRTREGEHRYVVTKQQEQAFAQWREAQSWQAMLAFWMAVIDHDYHKESHSLLISGMAVLGWDDVHQTWRSPAAYLPKMSALITVARMLVILQAHGISGQTGESVFAVLQKTTPGLLTMAGAASVRRPMSFLLHLYHYAKAAASLATKEGRARWTGPDTLSYGHLTLSIPQLKTMVHAMIGGLQEGLGAVLVGQAPPAVVLKELRDDFNCEDGNYSFLRESRLDDTWLWKRVVRSQLSARFFADGEVINLALKRYMDAVHDWRAVLLALVHLTGGAPARGTEITTIRHRNGRQGEKRGVFIEDGVVDLATGYHKGSAMSGKHRIVHRYLPHEVGLLVVVYVWLVQPFVEFLTGEEDGRLFPQEELGRALRAAFHKHTQQSVGVLDWRHMCKAIMRRHLGWEEEEDDDDDPMEEQFGHSTHTGRAVYGRTDRDQKGLLSGKPEQFRSVSARWHRLLGLETRFTKQPNSDTEAVRRRNRLAAADASAALEHVLPGATWRPGQQRLLEAVLQRSRAVLAILPTGAGKSLAFMLPHIMEPGGMSLVVVPLLALRSGLMARCNALGIRAATWQEGACAQVVLVTPEGADTDGFKAFLQRQLDMHRLDRIFIDECHLILTAAEWRPAMLLLKRLAWRGVPVVYLTGTLPPALEGEFMRRIEDNIEVQRESTRRLKMAYHVVHSTDVEQHVRGRTIVFCQTIRDTDALAEELGCSRFHSKLGADEKERVLQGLLDGRVQMVAATSALGMGVDIPDIDTVIHYKTPRNMLDFAQESGRAGRDGRPCRSVVLYDEVTPVMAAFLTAECPQKALNEYLDGIGEECGREQEPCGRCAEMHGAAEERQRREAHAHELGRQQRVQAAADQSAFTDFLGALLLTWWPQCMVCSPLACGCAEQGQAQKAWLRAELRRTKPAGTCFECGLPWAVCGRHARGLGAQCKFQGMRYVTHLHSQGLMGGVALQSRCGLIITEAVAMAVDLYQARGVPDRAGLRETDQTRVLPDRAGLRETDRAGAEPPRTVTDKELFDFLKRWRHECVVCWLAKKDCRHNGKTCSVLQTTAPAEFDHMKKQSWCFKKKMREKYTAWKNSLSPQQRCEAYMHSDLSTDSIESFLLWQKWGRLKACRVG